MPGGHPRLRAETRHFGVQARTMKMVLILVLLFVLGTYAMRYALCAMLFSSKYPPAKPGALRLLAPQRGLIAIGQNQNREPFIVRSIAKVLIVVIPAKAGIQFFLDSGLRSICSE